MENLGCAEDVELVEGEEAGFITELEQGFETCGERGYELDSAREGGGVGGGRGGSAEIGHYMCVPVQDMLVGEVIGGEIVRLTER